MVTTTTTPRADLPVRLVGGQLVAGGGVDDFLEHADAVVHEDAYLRLLLVHNHIVQLDQVLVVQATQALDFPASNNILWLEPVGHRSHQAIVSYLSTFSSPFGILRRRFFFIIFTALRSSVTVSSTSFTFE